MSVGQFDEGYCQSNTVRSSHGSIRVTLDQSTLDQSTPLLPVAAEQVSVQADKVLGCLVYDAFQAGSALSHFVMRESVCEGSASSEGAAWQNVNGGLHVRARVVVTATRAVPDFAMSVLIDMVLWDFRRYVRKYMDPSYQDYLDEKAAREAAADHSMVFSACPSAPALLAITPDGENTMLSGNGGMMVGRAFGSFGHGGFAQG